MGITFGDHLIDSGYYDITPEQEREIDARAECARRGIDPDEICADGGVTAWMVVDQEIRSGAARPREGEMRCPRYEMDCPVDPCPRICEAGKIRPPLRYPNLEVSDPRPSEVIVREMRDEWRD